MNSSEAGKKQLIERKKHIQTYRIDIREKTAGNILGIFGIRMKKAKKTGRLSISERKFNLTADRRGEFHI